MSSELRDLYQEVILDHGRRPRNFRTIEGARHVEGYNPLCGDRIHLYVDLDHDTIRDLAFQGSGCAISTASASVMTEVLRGKRRDDAEKLFTRFHDIITGASPPDPELGKLAVFGGVSEYPARVKCAALAWHALKAALEGSDQPVTTE